MFWGVHRVSNYFMHANIAAVETKQYLITFSYFVLKDLAIIDHRIIQESRDIILHDLACFWNTILQVPVYDLVRSCGILYEELAISHKTLCLIMKELDEEEHLRSCEHA